MIKFIYGCQGSGKTDTVLKMLLSDAEAGIPSVLIVPEQEAVQAERLTLEKLPEKAQLTVEVLNFSRLYNRVCREYGGLCYSYITSPTKHLMMWLALRQVAPTLQEYSENAKTDPAFISTMLRTVSELKASDISCDELERAAKECENTHPLLAARLFDIATIYATYSYLVNQGYSDSADDLSRLCDILDKHSFFKGKNVYIDSFTSFTGIEHKVIEKIFASAENTVITVPLTQNDISTKSIEQSVKLLKKSANKWGGHNDTVLDKDKRGVHNSLIYLSENLWSLGKASDTAPDCEGHIVMEICDNSYSEAEAIASHILKLLGDGARCRDIVVIPRDSQRYRGIIELAFENAGLPYYFSEKSDICSLPPVKFVLTALKIRRYNWQRGDVISHIKTGLCNFSQRECDLFEEYINTWSISGSRFTSGEWSMNPDGFEVRISERGKNILKIANEIRASLCELLEALFIELDASNTISDMCRALFRYIEKTELREKTLQLAKKELSFGNKKTAAELTSLYDVMLSTLASIGEITSDVPASIDDFCDILKTVFDQTEVGTIPTSIDEVIIGSAPTIRSANPKYVFVPGLCEGEFPANVDDTGLIGNSDRLLLEEFNIILGNTEDTRASDELLYVKAAFAAPTERLYLLTSNTNAKGDRRSPSLPFRRTAAIMGITPHKFNGNDLSFLVGSPRSAASHLRNISNTADKRAATDAVAIHLPLVSELSNISATPTDNLIDPVIVKRVLKDKLYVSPSSLEKYVKCPFNYFANYWLSLREVKQGRFGSNHFGSFIHYIMENIVKFILPEKADQAPPTDEEIRLEMNRIVSEYISRLVSDPSYNTKRMEYLYGKLQRLSSLIIENTLKEFADSDFRPMFFEYGIGRSADMSAAVEISLSNSASIMLTGSVDRVDIWKHEGKVYVRIVDYKSGKKQFSLDDVAVGMNIQMLLYLFAICKNPGSTFRTSTGMSDNEYPIPAGVVYLSSHMVKQTLNDYSDTEDIILDNAEQSIVRSGIILDNQSVINAMSHSASKDILIGVEYKDGKYVGKALLSDDDFDMLYSEIRNTLTEIGEKIYSGYAGTEPLYPIKSDPCGYCNYRQICRKNNFERRR